MLSELLKALLVGAGVALPFGPVLVFVMEKTLSRGRWNGVAAGCGSALVDTAYAAAGFFALSFVSGFIESHKNVMLICGGAVVLLVGIMMFCRTKNVCSNEYRAKKTRYTSFGYMFQTMGCALSNPGAFAVMLAALALTGLNAESVKSPVALILVCVFCGEVGYWTLLTGLVSRYVRLTPETLRKVSRYAGIIVLLFGIALIINGLILL